MKCPRCVQRLAEAASSCGHCGFEMSAACALYGEGAVMAERVMDAEGVLSGQRYAGVMGALERFERDFPQLFLMLYVGALPAPPSPRQFAFWLLNHAAVAEVEAWRPNERGLLLVVDPQGGTAVLASGYFLEGYLSQGELDGLLRSAVGELGAGDYAGVVEVVRRGLRKLLSGRLWVPGAGAGGRESQGGLLAGRGFPGLVRTGESVGRGGMGAAGPVGTGVREEVTGEGLDGDREVVGSGVRKRREGSAGKRNNKLRRK